MRDVVPGIELTTDGARVASETTRAAVGPHVLVLTTTVPTAALTVITTYTGADDVDTRVTDLALARRPRATAGTRLVPRAELPVTHARDRCLLDHLAQVRTALAELCDLSARVDVRDAALHELTAP